MPPPARRFKEFSKLVVVASEAAPAQYPGVSAFIAFSVYDPYLGVVTGVCVKRVC